MSAPKGRLGLETARVAQADRHGCLWLGKGRLFVKDGTAQFVTSGYEEMDAGSYGIPFQTLTSILLEPGVSITYDVLRLCARHGTGIVVVGEGGVRLYASMPFGPDASTRARRQAELWADAAESRLQVARRMYAWRLGEIFPKAEISVLRGMEGARVKEDYKRIADEFGVQWRGRRYDRSSPDTDDLANQAINHASTAVTSLAMVAVAVTGAIPQLGFIHETSGYSFALDIADLFRSTVTVPVAFEAAKNWSPEMSVERSVRKRCVSILRERRVISSMIDRIKELFGGDDSRCDPGCP